MKSRPKKTKDQTMQSVNEKFATLTESEKTMATIWAQGYMAGCLNTASPQQKPA